MELKRIPYWDNLKGFLIVLVVLGHTGTAMGDKWLSVIYAFHMPLFVYVSGFFSRKKESLWASIGRLLIIYLVFNTAYLLLDVLLGTKLTFGRLLVPSFALWYILSLVIWRMIIFFVPNKVLDNHWIVLMLSFILCFIAGFIPIGTEMSFQRTMVFLPFFLLGFYTKRMSVGIPVQQANRYVYLIVIFAVCFCLLSLINYLIMPVFYANTAYNGINDLVIRVIQVVIALLLSIFVLYVVPNRAGLFSKLGESSLLIYLLHPPIIKITKILLSKGGVEATPIIALIITALTIAILYSIRNLRVLSPLR